MIRCGDNKSQTFNTWANEFFVNVFTQLFHALSYILVVNGGVQAFIENDDWLLLTICVMFLFQGEKILRAIFNIKSSANTIGELATTAASVAGVSKMITDSKLFSKKEEKDEEEIKSNPQRAIPMNNTNPVAPSASNTFIDNNENNLEDATNKIDDTNLNNINLQRIQNAVLNEAIQARNKHRNSKIGKYTQKAFRGAGMVTGLAAGLAVGNADNAISKNMLMGKEIGNTLSNAVTAPIRGISNAYSGSKMKRAIQRGDMDSKLGFDSNTKNETQKASQDAYRKALAKMASTASRKGVDAGRAKFWSELD